MNVTELSAFKEKCTGCLACVQICPVKAMRCEKDKEGFYYPVVNFEKCINCGKCLNTCCIKKEHIGKTPLLEFSAFSNDNRVRNQGSSGGIVVALSELISSKDGIVYGAAFNKKEKEIHHSSTKEATLYDLSRSKYVQSCTMGTFLEVENDLKAGKDVLFCGTPCQVEGLHNYLSNEYDNLFTIDFFCHGVPSSGVFKNMILEYEEEENSEVNYVSFRDKKDGWHKLALEIGFENGKKLRYPASESPYYFYFLNNYSLRQSCYCCERYKNHLADITVADYWSVNKEADDDKGVSLVLVNTEKGKAFVNEIKKEINVNEFKEKPDYSIYKHNYTLKNREMFFESYINRGIQHTFKELFEKEKKKKQVLSKIKRKVSNLLRK